MRFVEGEPEEFWGEGPAPALLERKGVESGGSLLERVSSLKSGESNGS